MRGRDQSVSETLIALAGLGLERNGGVVAPRVGGAGARLSVDR